MTGRCQVRPQLADGAELGSARPRQLTIQLRLCEAI
jgi:hypothetical protein